MIELVPSEGVPIRQGRLVYIVKDMAFATAERVDTPDASISINTLYLWVDRTDRIVKYVDGYAPHRVWSQGRLQVPIWRYGIIEVSGAVLERGDDFAYDRASWPIVCDRSSGWVCVGDRKRKGEAWWFAPGTGAMFADGRLVSLWLHPEELPRKW